jgi:thioredoxin-related protein
MTSRTLIAVFFCFALARNADAAGAALPAPVNLQRDAVQAQKEGKPVVILFTLPGCSFCQVVRQNYLAPLLRDLPVKERPIIREVEIDGTQTFVGFKGEIVSYRSLARTLNIRFAPTVVFLDSSGDSLTDPIVGGDVAGLYGGYLDRAFSEATKKLAAARRANITGR